MIDIDALKRDKRPQSSTLVHALIDRLEAAESEAFEEARLNGMGAERELALMAKLEAAEKSDAESLAMYRKARDERDALRAKIEAMERQEPVAWVVPPSSRPHWGEHAMQDAAWEARQCGGTAKAEPLYTLTGAQPALNVPEGWIQRGMAELEAIRSRLDDDTLLDDRTLIERIGKAMLAAAPEAKP